MKRLLLALLISAPVIANEATVLKVEPAWRMLTVVEQVPQVIEVCRDSRGNPGLIGGLADGLFGSTGGVVGSAIGYVIADELGGSGTRRDITRIAGTVVGNAVGNSVHESSQRKSNCEYREVTVTRDVVKPVADGYMIDVEMNGSRFTVQRGYSPEVGSKIPVIVEGVR
jgi:uncharacterized protein YcfJ